MSGKGSKARPKSVDGQQFADNWDKIFNLNNTRVAEGIENDTFFERPHDNSNFDLAGDFMKAFSQEVLDRPTLPSSDLAKLRLELIREEFEELTVATNAMDIIEIADALTDILYVVYGAGHAFGIDLDKCYAEVHRSNMSKLGEDGKPIYRADGKILKGQNYSKPDLTKIILGE